MLGSIVSEWLDKDAGIGKLRTQGGDILGGLGQRRLFALCSATATAGYYPQNSLVSLNLDRFGSAKAKLTPLRQRFAYHHQRADSSQVLSQPSVPLNFTQSHLFHWMRKPLFIIGNLALEQTDVLKQVIDIRLPFLMLEAVTFARDGEAIVTHTGI